MKRLFYLFLSMVILLCVTAVPVTADEIYISADELGGGVKAVINTETGVLTFSGSEYFKVYDTAVWQGYENKVTKIVLEEGITLITDSAFTGLYNVKTVELPLSLTYVMENAFANITDLSVVYKGTQAQWAKVTVEESGNKSLINAQYTYTGTEEEATKVITSFSTSGLGETYEFYKGAVATGLPTQVAAYYNNSLSYKKITLTYLNQVDTSIPGLQTINVIAPIPDGYVLGDGVSNEFSFTVKIIIGGTFGTSARWSYDNINTLTISGFPNTSAATGDISVGEAPWNEYLENITVVKIGNFVSQLGAGIFVGANTEEIIFSKYLKTISAAAFENIPSLKSLTVESTNSCFVVKDKCLYDTNYTQVLLYTDKTDSGSVSLDAVTKIGEYAFQDCSLSSVTIPSTVIDIADTAFDGCENITIKTQEGSYAYNYAVSHGIDTEIIATVISSVTTPDDVSIPLYSSVVLPSKVAATTLYGDTVEIGVAYATIPSSDSLGTTSVTAELVVPQNYELADGVAQTVTFDVIIVPASGTAGDGVTWTYSGDGVLEIGGAGELVFNESPWSEMADEITKVTISSGITGICNTAFDGLALAEIAVDSENSNYISEDGILYDYNKTTLVKYPANKSGASYTVPDGVTAIAEHAFDGCVNLTSVTIGEDVISMNNTGLENSGITLIVFDGSYALQYAKDNNILYETKAVIVETGVRSGVTYTLYSDGYLHLEYEGKTSISTLPIDLDAVKVLECAEGMTGFASNLLKYMPDLTTIKLPSTFYATDFLDGTSTVSEVIIAEGNESLCTIDGAVYSITPNGLRMLYYLYSNDKVFTMTAENVFGIEYGAFDNAVHLEKIILNGDIGYIDSVFEGCENLKEFYIEPAESNTYGTENGVLYSIDIDGSKYSLIRMPQNSSITDFAVPDTVTRLANYAFKDCKNLVNVTMGDNVVNKINIGDGCGALFENAVNLESVVLSDNYEEIHNDTFKGCAKLKSFNFPKNLKYIGYSAFEGCASLTGTLEIPSTVTGADDKTFMGTGYNEIIIPSSFTYIEPDMFADCVNLEKVTLAEGVEDISSRAFSGCSKLKEINFPDSIESVGGYAFYNCVSLEKVELDNVTVSANAFSGCSRLTDFSLNSGVIKKSVFANCTSLKNVTLGDNVTEINQYAFNGCTTLAEFTVPKGVKTLYRYVFDGCTNLKKLVINSENAVFHDRAYYEYSGIEEIVLPDTVRGIGHYVFSKTGIKSITLSECTEFMNTYVLADCLSLTTAVLPESITEIPLGTFSGCTALKEVYINGKITSVCGSAFENCTSLEKVYFAGTKAKWTEIIVEYGNDALLKAEIICSDGTITQPRLSATLFEVYDGSIDITVNLPEGIVAQNAIVAVSCFNDEGYAGMQAYSVSAEDRQLIGVNIADASVKTVKLHLWEDFNGIKPLTEVKTLIIR